MRSRMLTIPLVGAAGLALALAAPFAASAHVALATASSLEPGTSSHLSFGLGHGCDGSPTTAVSIALPAEISGVQPFAKAGWTAASTSDAEGTTVTFTAEQPLDGHLRDTFDVQVFLPEDGAGETFAMPAEQTCAEGAESWSDPDQASDHPAPVITLAAPEVETAAEPEAGVDETARGIGIAGGIVGALGVLVATIAVRRERAARR